MTLGAQELEQAGADFRSGYDIELEVEQIRRQADRVDGLRWEQEWQQHHVEKPAC